MQQPERENLKECWIRRARQLDEQGRFRLYNPKQRADVLRKGFLGKWPPDMAIEIARKELQERRAMLKERVSDRMRDCYGIVGEEVHEILLRLLEEVPPQSYDPPAEARTDPAYPFIFKSNVLRSEVYLKFQLAGTNKKPQVLFWSCHPPEF